MSTQEQKKKLRQRLDAAEERGYLAALADVSDVVENLYENEVAHRPSTNIFKQPLHAAYAQVLNGLTRLGLPGRAEIPLMPHEPTHQPEGTAPDDPPAG